MLQYSKDTSKRIENKRSSNIIGPGSYNLIKDKINGNISTLGHAAFAGGQNHITSHNYYADLEKQVERTHV